MERPRITIADTTPKEMKRFEHVFDLELRIANLNESALPIKGFALEGRALARGAPHVSI
jgi:hypothetical protein